MQGYIKIHRNILEWEWWSDINTYRLFTYMILRANWKDGKFKGIDIKKGSFVSSVRKLSEETNLTENEIRTAIKHLIKTNEITSKTHGKFTVFTVNNYLLYQEDNEQLTSKSQADNEQITDKSQTDNEQLTSSSQPVNDLLTTIEEKKEYKESNNITVSNETVCQTDVRLIVETWNKLQEYGVKPVSRLNSDSKRYQMLAARIRQYGAAGILSAISKVKSSNFLQGKNDRGWMITFDWFILPNNFLKVFEGNYDNTDKQKNLSTQKSSSNKFNNFSQRDYDYDEFEKNFVNKGLI